MPLLRSKRKTSTPRRPAITRGFLICVAACMLGAAGARAQFFSWTGGTSGNVTVGSNYYNGTVPTFGGNITAGLTVQNGSDNAFTYTAAQGTSAFSGYLYVGQNNVGSARGQGTSASPAAPSVSAAPATRARSTRTSSAWPPRTPPACSTSRAAWSISSRA